MQLNISFKSQGLLESYPWIFNLNDLNNGVYYIPKGNIKIDYFQIIKPRYYYIKLWKNEQDSIVINFLRETDRIYKRMIHESVNEKYEI